MVYSVLVAHYHELKHQQVCWVLGTHLFLCWRYSQIYRVSMGSDNAMESAPGIVCIFVSCGKH